MIGKNVQGVFLGETSRHIRRINLFGGPGLGKSLTASRLYSDLKITHKKVELVREFIKEWAYQGIVPESFDQVFVLASQLHSEDLLLRHVDFIVTDGPVLMTIPCLAEMNRIIGEFEKKFPSLNILLQRDGIAYQQDGRYENPDQAVEMDLSIEHHLSQHVEYHKFSSLNCDKILNFVKASIEHDNC